MKSIASASGFSLIELMIVVAISSILSVIAIPSYQSYTQRARFTEILAVASAFKTAVSVALQEGIPIVECVNGKHGIPIEPKATKNLASVKVEGGTITATATDLLGNATYVLKPSLDGSVWSVSGTCLKSGLCNA